MGILVVLHKIISVVALFILIAASNALAWKDQTFSITGSDTIVVRREDTDEKVRIRL